MKLDVKELWGKAWSLRPGQNTANMKYVGTIIKSGIRFTYQISRQDLYNRRSAVGY